MGGEMGKATDMTGLQFRMLNTKKGPAVWAPRAQCDKSAYRTLMREVLERESNLRIVQAEAAELLLKDGPPRSVTGVLLRDGRRFLSGAVILTPGTFLNGVAHVGENIYTCGRSGEPRARSVYCGLSRDGSVCADGPTVGIG